MQQQTLVQGRIGLARHKWIMQVMDERVTIVLFYLHKTITPWTVALELSRQHAFDGITDLRHTGLALN